MSDDADNNSIPASAEIGGLPALIAGPAGKAISRLIGATADTPAAWLEGVAQGHRDRTEAKSVVSKAIATKAAELAVDNPQIMERALHSMLAKSYRSQENREAVASIAAEDLSKAPPPVDGEGPSDDWMNKFERHAEDASGGQVRTMFGKLLAEEVREPGKISSSTLRFVSELDSEVARIIQRALSVSMIEGSVLIDAVEPNLSYSEKKLAEQSGFWSAENNMRLILEKTGNLKRHIITRENSAIEITLFKDIDLSIPCALLSKAGLDLIYITDVEFDYDAVIRTIQQQQYVQQAVKKQAIKKSDGWIVPSMEVTITEKPVI